MKTEEWRDIIGYEGLYQVSNLGRVRSLVYGKNRLLRLSLNGVGYLRVDLSRDGKHHTRNVHQLVTVSFLGKCPSGLVTNHVNGIKTDNRLENLEYITQSENVRHAYRTGLQIPSRFEKTSMGKLTEVQVGEIKELLEDDTLRHKDIAKMYGVCRQTITRINEGKTGSGNYKRR